jgi:hypothetical protein
MRFVRALRPTLAVLLVLGFVALAVWGVVALFSGLQKEVAAALVTALGAVLVVVVTRIFERRSEFERALRVAKAPIYEDFVTFWMDTLTQASATATPAPEALATPAPEATTAGAPATAAPDAPATPAPEATNAPDPRKFFQRFTKGLIVYGSAEMVQSWSTYRRRYFASPQPPPDPNLDPTILLGFEKILSNIRREFNHHDRRLKRGDLLGLFVDDVDTLLALEAARSKKSAGRPQSPPVTAP